MLAEPSIIYLPPQHIHILIHDFLMPYPSTFPISLICSQIGFWDLVIFIDFFFFKCFTLLS